MKERDIYSGVELPSSRAARAERLIDAIDGHNFFKGRYWSPTYISRPLLGGPMNGSGVTLQDTENSEGRTAKISYRKLSPESNVHISRVSLKRSATERRERVWEWSDSGIVGISTLIDVMPVGPDEYRTVMWLLRNGVSLVERSTDAALALSGLPEGPLADVVSLDAYRESRLAG